MGNIYYYNINYYCNNDCKFCFSSSTGDNKHSVSKTTIISELSKTVKQDDTVVLNGGEPTIHPEFYNILNFIIENFMCNVVVYSNGRKIDDSKIIFSSRIRFVIPIHGDRKIHDAITQKDGSFEDKLMKIKKLYDKGYKVNIKFIISQDFIDSAFSVKEFLEENNLPNELVIIARLNDTKKSILNGVRTLELKKYKEFVADIFNLMSKTSHLMFLDTPVCYLPEFASIELPEKPLFYFSDYEHSLVEKKYYKELLIEKNCMGCNYRDICKLLSETYLTTYYEKKWIIKSE